jgi:Flp pilus assembly pilin Flp
MIERLSLIVLDAVHRVRTFDFKREEGQGVTEYGIVLAFVAIALAAILVVLKDDISAFIDKVGADLGNLPANV